MQNNCTKDEANDYMKGAYKMASEFKKTKEISFETAALEWLKQKKTEIRTESYHQYEFILKDRLFPKIARRKLKYICKKQNLEELEKEFLEEGYSDVTVQNYMTIVKSVVYFYKGRLRTVGTASSENEKNAFSKTEVKKIIAKANSNKDYRNLGILLILYTGMIISEISALKWEDIDLESKTISVTKVARRIIDVDEEGTKIVELQSLSPRKVPISHNLYEVLKLYFEDVSDTKSFVLTNTAKLMEPRSFQYYIQSFSKEFKKKYSAADFRDIFIINSLQKEMSLIVLSEILGVNVCHIYQEYQNFIKVSNKTRERELKKIKY